EPQEVAEADTGAIRIAVIGRPNVGKSTLVNRLLGEERVIASEEPGTTRDSILVPFERDGRAFLLIDTAGLRRRARVEDAVERVSVAKTLQAIDEAHVVILVLDAHDTVAEQDASVLGLALERGRRIKLRYAHQGGRNPPRIVIHGNQTASVPDAYTRYLANVFRKTYDLFATPVVIEYRTDANPYDRERRAKPRPGRPRRRAREKQRR